MTGSILPQSSVPHLTLYTVLPNLLPLLFTHGTPNGASFFQVTPLSFCTRVATALVHLHHLNSFELSHTHLESQYRNNHTLTVNVIIVEKEWIGLSVTPRLDMVEGMLNFTLQLHTLHAYIVDA